MANDIQAADLSDFLSKVTGLTTSPKLARPIHDWLTHLSGELGKGFLSSKSPTGEAWKPLKSKRPKGHNPGSRPLIDFGDLLASVASTGSGHVENVSDDGAEFGTDVEYAGYHQFGTDRIPERPFIGASDDMADLVAELAADELILQIEGL